MRQVKRTRTRQSDAEWRQPDGDALGSSTEVDLALFSSVGHSTDVHTSGPDAQGVGHRFGKMSVEPQIANPAAANQCADGAEQEAERVAALVVRADATVPRISYGTGAAPRSVGDAPPKEMTQLAAMDDHVRSTGQPLDRESRSFMESRFGADFRTVRVHKDPAAADSARAISSLAYTVGEHIVFGAAQDQPKAPRSRALLAHELTHVLQQRSRNGLEVSTDGRQLPGVVQRFGSREHQELGDVATNNAIVNAGGDDTTSRLDLYHGDVIALAGDYFETRELMSLARIPGERGTRPGTRDEVIYALHKVNSRDARFQTGGRWSLYTFSEPVMQAVDRRYVHLAAANDSHFASPVGREPNREPTMNRSNSADTYRRAHENAILLAYEAGRCAASQVHQPSDHVSLAQAFALDAAAQHFLTDSFAAGHLRTPIAPIRFYWGARYPAFWSNFQEIVAADTARRAAELAPAEGAHGVPERGRGQPVSGGTITSFLDTRIVDAVRRVAGDYPPIGLGDLVAKVFHDFDNEFGIPIEGGGRLFGDGHLHNSSAQNVTPALATEAIQRSNHDIQTAFNLGVGTPRNTRPPSLEQLTSRILQMTGSRGGRYRSEALIPLPSATGLNQNWQANTFEALWDQHMVGSHGPTVGQRIIVMLQRADSEIRQQLRELGRRFPPVQAGFPLQQAYTEGFIEPLVASPRAALRRMLTWRRER
jgi:Domain of unknown function (DUF4157)